MYNWLNHSQPIMSNPKKRKIENEDDFEIYSSSSDSSSEKETYISDFDESSDEDIDFFLEEKLQDLSRQQLISLIVQLSQNQSTQEQILTLLKQDPQLEPVFECINCGKEFKESQNFDTACLYHYGVLEVDKKADCWIDWDEESQGPIDTADTREELPEGFRWSCCGKSGDSIGCCTAKHEKE